MRESKLIFFRQSGWLAICNTMAGGFLFLVYPVISAMDMPGSEIAIYGTMLRFFALLAIPAAGLQIVMAQAAAHAVTPEEQDSLRLAARSVVQCIFLLWAATAILCGLFRIELVEVFQLSDPRQLWIVVLLVLVQLLMPFMQGLVQGLQNFLWLGLSMMCNGAGRLAATIVIVGFFGSQATGALAAAFIGVALAVGAAFWPSRHIFKPASGRFDWLPWVKRVLPLAAMIGSSFFVMQADMLLVQSHFPKQITDYYAAASIIGVGVVTFTAPMAAVMFPKLVRGFAQGARTDSLALASAGTLLLGLAAAVLCTLFPKLPLRIMFFRTPELWDAAVLVPWIAWSMLPLTLSNVLISTLMAQSRFAAAPWLLLVAIGYGFTLFRYVNRAQDLPMFDAFRGVIQILAIFSSLLLAVAFVFAFLFPKRPTVPQNPA